MEYRVWCHPEHGVVDLEEVGDYFYSLASLVDALEFAEDTEGAEEPLALIVQEEYIGDVFSRHGPTCEETACHGVARRVPLTAAGSERR